VDITKVLNNNFNSQISSISNLNTDIQPSQSVSQVQYEVEGFRIKDEDNTRSRERSWIWKYYYTMPEPGTWRLGNKERPEL